MNIVDSTKKSLVCSFEVTFATKQGDNSEKKPFFVYGSYQHAVSNVSLSESQDYELHYLGLGHVIYFDDDVIDEYDDTPGLEVFGSIYDK